MIGARPARSARPRRPAARLGLACAALLGAACLGPAPDPAPPDAAPEQSVRPGVNETYLSRELDVGRFTRIFEGESREVFASRREIVTALDLPAGAAVADVGAGTGVFLAPLVERVGPEGRVYAVEISPNFLEHLRARAEQEGWRQVQVVEGGERSTGLRDRSVDLVFVCDTYHHFEYPRSMLASIHRALRPGGFLVVVDFERVPGVSQEWVLDHVRAGKDVVRREIASAGFVFEREPELEGLKENYVLRFRRP
jgi:predicted methyltransferase